MNLELTNVRKELERRTERCSAKTRAETEFRYLEVFAKTMPWDQILIAYYDAIDIRRKPNSV